MSEYRVNLDIYNGPLDLLLYLIRRDELDIHDIPITRIAEQYIRYVDVLKEVDPNGVGEFLVMAATLMEIKTRMLLPTPPPEDAQAEGVEIDPRAELVRQLLEYKAFKDAAGDLTDAASQQALKFPRRPAGPSSDAGEVELEDAQVWDLLDAFNTLMAEIGAQSREHEVIYDDTPIELHAVDLMDRLRNDGPMRFREVFRDAAARSEMVGLFLALLELIRRRQVLASQADGFGEIHVQLNPDAPDPGADEPADEASAPPSEARADGSPVQPAAPSPGATDEAPGKGDVGQADEPRDPGRYVAAERDEDDGDSGAETAGAGA